MLRNQLHFIAKSESQVPAGVIIVTAIAIAIPLVIVVFFLQLDYLRHKRPLREADPAVSYTFWHHIKVVTIPLMSYRISFYMEKKDTGPTNRQTPPTPPASPPPSSIPPTSTSNL